MSAHFLELRLGRARPHSHRDDNVLYGDTRAQFTPYKLKCTGYARIPRGVNPRGTAADKWRCAIEQRNRRFSAVRHAPSKQVDRKPPRPLKVRCDAGERRLRVLADQFVVVDAHYGEFVRHGDSSRRSSGEHVRSHLVVRGEYPSRAPERKEKTRKPTEKHANVRPLARRHRVKCGKRDSIFRSHLLNDGATRVGPVARSVERDEAERFAVERKEFLGGYPGRRLGIMAQTVGLTSGRHPIRVAEHRGNARIAIRGESAAIERSTVHNDAYGLPEVKDGLRVPRHYVNVHRLYAPALLAGLLAYPGHTLSPKGESALVEIENSVRDSPIRLGLVHSLQPSLGIIAKTPRTTAAGQPR